GTYNYNTVLRPEMVRVDSLSSSTGFKSVGATNLSSAAVDVNGGLVYRGILFANPTEPDLKFIANASGQSHHLALDSKGRIWAWGNNSDGQLGIGNTRFTKNPMLIKSSRFYGAKIIAIAAGQSHSLALDEQERLWSWGANHSSQLGNATTESKSTVPLLIDLSPLNGARI